MAIQKVWTAEDISKNGQITIVEISPGKIRFRQPYCFLDSEGNRMDILKDSVTMTDVLWIDMPESIKTALLEIREYLYNMALEANGMKEGA